MDWINWIEKIGLPAGIILIISSMFFFLLKWVLQTSKCMIDSWQVSLKGLNDQFIVMQQANKNFTDQVNEAHKYQREEHKEMITILGRINGYKHD